MKKGLWKITKEILYRSRRIFLATALIISNLTLPSKEAIAGQPPSFYNLGPQNGKEGYQVSFYLNASDPEGGVITYSASNLPEFAELNANRFSWTPRYNQAGEYTVTFTVTDPEGLTATQNVKITVADVNTGTEGKPEHILIVINSASDASREVGLYYKERRGVPDSNVLYINTTTDINIPYTQFYTQIRDPIRNYLETNNLKNKILYIVTTYGIPYKVYADNPNYQNGNDCDSVDSVLANLYDVITQGSVRISPYWKVTRYNSNYHDAGLHFDSSYGIYLVLRLDGPSPEVAKGLVDKAMYAEKYLDSNSGTLAYLCGLPIIQGGGIDILAKPVQTAGYAWFADPNHVGGQTPGSWYASAGNNYYNVYNWYPGASGGNFQSFTARYTIRDTDTSLVVPALLAADFTATFGAVYEPTTSGIPQPAAFFDFFLNGNPYLTKHFNLAESMYMSCPLIKWKAVVIGDPLYKLPDIASIDTEPPKIENLSCTRVGQTAVIKWDNYYSQEGSPEATRGSVDYGPTESYGQTLWDGTLLKYANDLKRNYFSQHKITLNNLDPTKRYYARVNAQDPAGNLTTQDFVIYADGETPGPKISNVSVSNITQTSCKISWTTDVASTSQVNYGLDTNYNLVVSDSALVTTHGFDITGLTANTTYHYQVFSKDALNNQTMTVDSTFTTLPIQYTLTTSATNGSVTKNPDKATYNAGESVTLTATADTGYAFSSWSGDISGSENPLSITMDSNKSITASFTLIPANNPPVAEAGANQTTTVGQTVTFDASSSKDSDGSITKYEWDFENDGTYDYSGTTAITTHKYTIQGTYTATLRVTDNQGAQATDTLMITVNPFAPTDLKAIAVSHNQINLSWQDNSIDELGFKIERRSNLNPTYIQIADVSANTIQYEDTGLQGSTSYSYRIYAYNTTANSIYSNTAYAMTFPADQVRSADFGTYWGLPNPLDDSAQKFNWVCPFPDNFVNPTRREEIRAKFKEVALPYNAYYVDPQNTYVCPIPWQTIVDNGWELVDDVVYEYGHGYQLADPGAIGYAEAWADAAIIKAKEAKVDFIFIDSIVPTLGWTLKPEQRPARYATDTQWQAAMKHFLGVVSEKVHSAGLKLAANIANMNGASSWYAQVTSLVDSYMNERFAFGRDSGTGWGLPSNRDKSVIEQQINEAQATDRKMILDAPSRQDDPLYDQRARFAVAMYLIARKPGDIFVFFNTPYDPVEGPGYPRNGYTFWHPSFEEARNLGKILSPPRKVGEVWFRKYEKAVILLNPTDQVQPIPQEAGPEVIALGSIPARTGMIIDITTNQAPVLEEIAPITINEGESIILKPIATDPDGDEVTLTYSGWMTSDTYTTNYQDAGEHSVTITASDGELSVAKEVKITVNNVNQPPTAQAQSVVTPEDTAIRITLSGQDADNDTLEHLIITYPAHGRLEPAGNEFIYTPQTDYSGEDEFIFKVSDGTLDSLPATVTITITAVNDAPKAEDLTITTDEDVPDNLILKASDIDGDSLSYRIVTNSTGGTLSGTAPNLTYTPTADYHGSDSFTFKVNDGKVDSNIATVSITINPVNDVPELKPIGNQSIDENKTLTFAVLGNDVDGDILAYRATGLPQGASFDTSTHTFSWTPSYAQAGVYQVTFTVTDSILFGSETITITVNNVNRAPDISGIPDALIKDESQVITKDEIEKAVDPDDDALTYIYSGWLTSLPYTISYSEAGTHTLHVEVSDGKSVPLAKDITITVNNVNRAPDISAIPDTLTKDEAQTITQEEIEKATDPDGDALTYIYSGWLTSLPYSITYSDSGTYTLQIKVTDGIVSQEKDIVITVNNVSRPSEFSQSVDTITITENEQLNYKLPEVIRNYGSGLVYELKAKPDWVTFSEHSRSLTGKAPFTSQRSYQLIWQAQDSEGSQDFVLTLDVTDKPRPPRFKQESDSLSLNEGQELNYALPEVVKDADFPDDQLSYSLLSAPDFVTLDQSNRTLKGAIPFDGKDRTYPVVVKATGLEGKATFNLSLQVKNTNRAPLIKPPLPDYTILEGQNLTFAIKVHDLDAEDTLVISLSGAPDGATFLNHTFNWRPNYTQSGTYLLTLTASDGDLKVSQDFKITVVDATPPPEEPVSTPEPEQSESESNVNTSGRVWIIVNQEQEGERATKKKTQAPDREMLSRESSTITSSTERIEESRESASALRYTPEPTPYQKDTYISVAKRNYMAINNKDGSIKEVFILDEYGNVLHSYAIKQNRRKTLISLIRNDKVKVFLILDKERVIKKLKVRPNKGIAFIQEIENEVKDVAIFMGYEFF